MWPTVKYNDGISAKYGLDPANAAEIFDIKNDADKSDSAMHNGRQLKKTIFSKVKNWFKFESKNNRSWKEAKVALRVENIAFNPLRDTSLNRENPIAKVGADIPASAVQTGIEAAAHAKLAFETSVMVINKRLDNIGVSIDELVRSLVKPKPALIATAINDLSGAQDFMKDQAESFMQIANARSPIPEPMNNHEASADARNTSGQRRSNAVVKFDKSAMRSMLNSIRADMRDVFIAEAKAKPADKKFYIPLTEGLLARLDKAQASMKAVVEAEGASWDEWLADDKGQFDLDTGTAANGARAVADHSSVEPFYEEILRPLLDENGELIPYKSGRTDIA